MARQDDMQAPGRVRPWTIERIWTTVELRGEREVRWVNVLARATSRDRNS
jgi:hypothetical protein